jgi:hypothetical protein
MKASVAEDKAWRQAEFDSKIDIEHELSLAEQNKLVKFYSPLSWLMMEQIQRTLPVYVSGIGHDERSSAGKTKPQRIDYEDTEEHYAKTTSTETEANPHIESTPSTDTHTEDEITCESIDAVIEAEEMAQAA